MILLTLSKSDLSKLIALLELMPTLVPSDSNLLEDYGKITKQLREAYLDALRDLTREELDELLAKAV